MPALREATHTPADLVSLRVEDGPQLDEGVGPQVAPRNDRTVERPEAPVWILVPPDGRLDLVERVAGQEDLGTDQVQVGAPAPRRGLHVHEIEAQRPCRLGRNRDALEVGLPPLRHSADRQSPSGH